MIKAIETQLWGYAFRSRIEARWAVFFDRLGIEWQYETQGFMLPSGPYLPDFFLPQFGLWFEVKGQAADDEERQRCRELSYSEWPVLLAEGPVGEKPLTLFCLSLDNSGGGEWQSVAYLGKPPTLFAEENVEQKTLCNHEWEHLKCDIVSDFRNAWRFSLTAIQAARSARFEHGQSPRRLSCN